MQLVHYDDGKQKWESHEIYLQEDDNFYHIETGLFSHNISDVRGYGATKKEALQDFERKFEWLLDEYKALKKLLFETDIMTSNIVEVDCFGKEIY